MMLPIVEKLSVDFAEKAYIYKVNADTDGALAAGLGIMSIPTMIFYKNGEEVERVIGAVPEDTLRGKLDAIC